VRHRHDNNGNMTGDETGRVFKYDAWDRLVTQMSGSTETVRFYYDARGYRAERRVGSTSALESIRRAGNSRGDRLSPAGLISARRANPCFQISVPILSLARSVRACGGRHAAKASAPVRLTPRRRATGRSRVRT
jgi:YD repeat-containing protein